MVLRWLELRVKPHQKQAFTSLMTQMEILTPSVTMFSLLLMSHFLVVVICKEIKENKTSFQGESILFRCSSSYVPIWEWHGRDKKENLAIGTSKRENLKDVRWLKNEMHFCVFGNLGILCKRISAMDFWIYQSMRKKNNMLMVKLVMANKKSIK